MFNVIKEHVNRTHNNQGLKQAEGKSKTKQKTNIEKKKNNNY